jgi:hypothetical protein
MTRIANAEYRYSVYNPPTTPHDGRPGGHCNANSAYNPCHCRGGVQFSSQAQMLMRFMSMVGQLLGGPAGELLSAFGACGQNQGQMHPLSNAHPDFGQPRNPAMNTRMEGDCGGPPELNAPMHFRRTQGGPCGPSLNSRMMVRQMAEEARQRMEHFQSIQADLRRAKSGNCSHQPRRGAMNALQNLTGSAGGAATGALFGSIESSAPRAPRGKSTEMKAGQTMKAPNGSLVKWGKDGNVGIKYKDPNGKMRTVDVKNGMLSMDGGKPVKLENVGQILKLPNGDVIGLGNNPQGPEGKKLCRVVLADNADQISTDPADATNVYDIKMMQEKQTSTVSASYDSCGSFGGHGGSFHSKLDAWFTTTRNYQELDYNSVK